MKKKLLALSAALLLLALACGGPETTPTPAPIPTPIATATPTPTPTATPPPIATPTPGPPSTPSPTPLIVAGLFLEVTNLPKESVVHTNTVRIDGRTSPDAIVSVNGILVEVDEEGRFSAIVSLEEGTNLIEVIASDFEGNTESSVLALINTSL